MEESETDSVEVSAHYNLVNLLSIGTNEFIFYIASKIARVNKVVRKK